MSSQAVAVERVPAAEQRTRRGRPVAGAWLLSGAMVISGVLAYVFHVLAARALGPHDYGQIAVLWAAMFLVAIVLFRPLEQTTSRALAERLARGEEVTTVLRAVAVLCVLVVAVCVVGAVAGWSAVAERLFLGSDMLTALLLAGIAAYGVAYLVRGLLGGLRWFNGYGLGLIADAVGRLLVAAPLFLVASTGLAAAAMVIAGLAGALVPLLLGRRMLRMIGTARPGARFRLVSALGFAAPASIVAAADQLLVNGGPLLVMIEGHTDASKAAGVVFAATMLIRAPVYVFQGLAAALLPNLTHIQAVAEIARFRQMVVRTVGFLLAAGAVIVAFAAIAGPQAMTFLYGSGFEAGRFELALLAAGVGCYLGAATISQALLALDEGVRAALAWTLASVLFVTLFFVLPGSELERVSLAFAIASLADFVLLGLGLVRLIKSR
ncbi:MAG: lipopolysaccharide biosynthesis protein [Nitriliruptorales bacterium]